VLRGCRQRKVEKGSMIVPFPRQGKKNYTVGFSFGSSESGSQISASEQEGSEAGQFFKIRFFSVISKSGAVTHIHLVPNL
jgi:hypothetical protein